MPLAQQVQNPVPFFATDNNGVIVELPAVSSAAPMLNGSSAPAGDFFFSIEIPTQRASNGKGGLSQIIREVGQCKLVREKLKEGKYEEEREKSANLDDIFMLYTDTEVSDDFALPDRSGLVDASCWDSYFGPFSSRAYMASRYVVPEGVTKI